MKDKIVITGCCGFVGFNLCKKLLEDKKNIIIGIDIISDYYDTKIKIDRLKILKNKKNFFFKKIDIQNFRKLNELFKTNKIQSVYNLAAQAGVQYSIKFPKKYMESNLNGFFNILELSRLYKVKKIFYASSSSVYGDVKQLPVSENILLNPKNFYGFSKKANEEMAEIYSQYYNIKIFGLRFFTIYGPWGRPDLVILKLIDAHFNKKKFYLNNNGRHSRDFTYIDDVIEIILKLSKINLKTIKENHQIFNISSSNPKSLIELIRISKKFLGKTKVVKRKFQKGDILRSFGDNKKILRLIGKYKFTNFEKGFRNTIEWYKKYNGL